ncbi:MAG TPA: hypothetical protein VD907_03235 [Verrucomicrobiae bacterium]|nr:hypothetical protein [Verrucomicrobiae bacterium]
MRFLKAVSLGSLRLLVFAACGVLSVFLIMSGYESIYNRSLPLVHTLDAVELQPFTGTYNLQDAAQLHPKKYGTYGKPKTIKLPGRSARLDIVPPLHTNSQWLARTNTMHLLLPENPRAGNIGVLFLYCRANIQTISQTNLPKIDSNIFVDTEHDWRYLYKVTHAGVTPLTEPQIVADNGTTGKMVIGCIDEAAKQLVTVEASLMSVQGIEV